MSNPLFRFQWAAPQRTDNRIPYEALRPLLELSIWTGPPDSNLEEVFALRGTKWTPFRPKCDIESGQAGGIAAEASRSGQRLLLWQRLPAAVATIPDNPQRVHKINGTNISVSDAAK
ncbi:MAG: hypothetical protein J0H18_10120 [Rhizobiales bacterium]|nr:hypothetical protein [Hyphomicrobiales bacterium]